MFDKSKVKQFRADFQLAVAQLEKNHNVKINLGTIRYDDTGLRAKMTAAANVFEHNGNGYPYKGVVEVMESSSLQIGDIVSIRHKKVNAEDKFKVIKINRTTVKVQTITSSDRVGALIKVSNELLIKV